MPERVVLYGTLTCPAVAPVKALLARSGVAFEYVGLEFNPGARETVKAIHGGDATVPTIVFPDGTTMSEPTRAELGDRLTSMGYDVRSPSTLDEAVIAMQHPFLVVFGAVLLAVGVSSDEIWMVSASLVMLGAVILSAIVRYLRFRGRV
jgi:mycoredoxin